MNIDIKIKEVSELSGISLRKENNITHHGANKEVICVRSKLEGKLALKCFKTGRHKRTKCHKEAEFLLGCRENKIDCVPKYIWHNESLGLLLETWLDGKSPEGITKNELPEIHKFIERLALSKHSNWNICSASDSMVIPSIYMKKIEARANYISKQICKNEAGIYLINKLKEKYKVLVEENLENAIYALKEARWLHKEATIMASPSDIGVHNMRLVKGKLYFYDFEHSGWDRPEKIYGDLLTRPGNFYGFNDEKQFKIDLTTQSRIYGENFVERFLDVLPTVQLKWILIIMDRKRIEEIGKKEIQVITELMEKIEGKDK